MEELALFPLDTVLFPHMPLALHIFEERYKMMIGRCIEEDTPFGVVLIREGREVGGAAIPFTVGTTAHIINVERLDEGRMNLICVGRQRFRLNSVAQRTPYLIGRVEYAPHELGERNAVYGMVVEVRELFMEYLRLLATIVDVEMNFTALPPDADNLAYGVAAAIQIANTEKQQWLENDSVQQILRDEAQRLPKEIVRLKMLAELERENRRREEKKIGPFSPN
jgi:hypothetical protein